MYLDGKQYYSTSLELCNIPQKDISAGWGDGSAPVFRGVPRAGS